MKMGRVSLINQSNFSIAFTFSCCRRGFVLILRLVDTFPNYLLEGIDCSSAGLEDNIFDTQSVATFCGYSYGIECLTRWDKEDILLFVHKFIQDITVRNHRWRYAHRHW